MSMFLPHAVLTNLNHQGSLGLLQILSSVVENVAPHLHLSHIALLARSCKALRVFVNDVGLLHYMLGFGPSLNSKDTRRRFLIPRAIPLRLVAKACYSQSYGLELAIQAHGGLKNFKNAWLKRREKTMRRRENAEKRLREKYRIRLRRIALVQRGLVTVGLGHIAPNLTRHIPYGMFIHNVANVSLAREDFHLSIVIENISWDYYLVNHTNYIERIRERIEVMGNYPGLVGDIISEYTHPEVWPWLE
jgi:hypothetical protein